ncbi:hypothetical protein [Pedobacter sp. KLB.chiD]|uniref:hypothetical protein n=1 Tax=Pedobacter sp. KLB.chiD TaxID=3387402 RepID=UPI0039999CC9
MNENKIKPQQLWDLYDISINSAHELLIAHGFRFLQRIENLMLYQAHGEAFTLTEESGVVTNVQYKMRDEAVYDTCIKHAKQALNFETLFEKSEPSADIIRLDDERCTLVGMMIKGEGDYQSLGITLLAKLPLPNPESRVEVVLQPPPGSSL